jgi:hypothetical protein
MKRASVAEPLGSTSPALPRVLSRVFIVYLGLFSLATQIAGSLFLIPSSTFDFNGFGALPPMRNITQWLATNVLGIAETLDYTTPGETTFFWVQTLWLLVAGICVGASWALFGGGKGVPRWFRLFFRLALASQMLEYGMTKIIPNQFAFPALDTLVTPVGNLSSSALLWTAIGASPQYQVVTGVAELACGILLLFSRTTLLGALLSLGALAHVLALNMSFDIPLKLTTTHLIFLALFLIAPDARRLGAFLLGRPADPPADLEPFPKSHARAWSQAVQLLWGAYLIAVLAYVNFGYWHSLGGGRPRSPLYGIWNVQLLSVDGHAGPATLNDYDRRWKRVIFDVPDIVLFQRTDDSFARYGASIDVSGKRVILTKGNSRTWQSRFSFEQPAENMLTLAGEMDGHGIRLELERVEDDTLQLLNSDFRWIYPDRQ